MSTTATLITHHRNHANETYARMLDAALKVNWKVEDVIGPDKRLDFSRPFLPEGLARVEPLTFLDAPERRALNQIRAFGLEQETAMYDEGAKGYLIAVPVGGGPTPGAAPGEPQPPAGPRGVITLLIEPRSKAALQSTLALVEVISGYIHAHVVRQLLKRTRAAGAARATPRTPSPRAAA